MSAVVIRTGQEVSEVVGVLRSGGVLGVGFDSVPDGDSLVDGLFGREEHFGVVDVFVFRGIESGDFLLWLAVLGVAGLGLRGILGRYLFVGAFLRLNDG